MAQFPMPHDPGTFQDRRATNEHKFDVAAWLAILTTLMVALATITPYFLTVPQANATLISQSQTTLYNGWLVILTYYYATNQLQGRKDAAIQSQAKAIENAQATLSAVAAASPGSSADINLRPGETATATATAAGTTIEKG